MISGLKFKLPLKFCGALRGFDSQAGDFTGDVNICIFKLMSIDYAMVLFGGAQSIKLKKYSSPLER